MLSVKCFEHFFEPSPNELAAFKLLAKFLQESNLKGIGIFMSNITVITLNKFGKRARGLLCIRISSSLPIIYPELSGFEAPDTRLKRKSYDKRKIDHVGHFTDIEELTLYIILVILIHNHLIVYPLSTLSCLVLRRQILA